MLIWGFSGQPEQFFSYLPKNFKHLGSICQCSLRFWAEMELFSTFKIFEPHKNFKTARMFYENQDFFQSVQSFLSINENFKNLIIYPKSWGSIQFQNSLHTWWIFTLIKYMVHMLNTLWPSIFFFEWQILPFWGGFFKK
jgi:hypothetical protein